MGQRPGQTGNPSGCKKDGSPPDTCRGTHKKGPRPKTPDLLSSAYKSILAKPISEDVKAILGLTEEENPNWAYAIGMQVMKRAVGMVPDDKICFKAVTEIRESTEGKTPERLVAVGGNEELAALANIMRGEPASTDSNDPVMEGEGGIDSSEDDPSEEAEANFHSTANEE